MKDTQIKINDTVRVTSSGETYTQYSEMFARMGFKNKTKNKSFEYGTQATVFAIDQHLEERHTLYGLVDSEGNECLISERGIKKIEYEVVDTSTIDGINDRLAQIESKLDQLAKRVIKPEKSQTAVEWLVDELLAYDWSDSESRLEVCMTLDKFAEIKATALQMEKQQNSK